MTTYICAQGHSNYHNREGMLIPTAAVHTTGISHLAKALEKSPQNDSTKENTTMVSVVANEVMCAAIMLQAIYI